MRVGASWVEVQGFGSGMYGSENEGSGFRVKGSGLKVKALGFTGIQIQA